MSFTDPLLTFKASDVMKFCCTNSIWKQVSNVCVKVYLTLWGIMIGTSILMGNVCVRIYIHPKCSICDVTELYVMPQFVNHFPIHYLIQPLFCYDQ